MKVKLSKSANKFLQKLGNSDRAAVLSKINMLKICLEKQQVYPPEELDIKKLKGELKGFSRIRVGKLRIIFQIHKNENEIVIFDIDFRGNVY
jgi:mRNA interferase RelE/StbE